MLKKFAFTGMVSLFAFLLIAYAYGDPDGGPNPSLGNANQPSSRGATGAQNSCPGLFNALANAPNPQAAGEIISELIAHGCIKKGKKGKFVAGAPPRDVEQPMALKGKLATSWGKIKANY